MIEAVQATDSLTLFFLYFSLDLSDRIVNAKPRPLTAAGGILT